MEVELWEDDEKDEEGFFLLLGISDGMLLGKDEEEHSAAGGNVAKEGAQGPMHCPVRESNSILKGRKVHKGSLSCKPPITAKLQN